MKEVKIAAGILMLCFSATCILTDINMISNVRGEAGGTSSYSAESYLEVAAVESSRAGGQPVTEWGEELPPKPGYTYYRLDCAVRNVSSVKYHGFPAEEIAIEEEDYDQVYGSGNYEGKNTATHDKLFYTSARPTLLGQYATVFPIYVQVKEGVSQVLLRYKPNYEEDEIVIAVPLTS